jgi:hypothetical protein
LIVVAVAWPQYLPEQAEASTRQWSYEMVTALDSMERTFSRRRFGKMKPMLILGLRPNPSPNRRPKPEADK